MWTALLVALIASSDGNAQRIDLGTLGPVYPIAETDMLASIEERIAVLQRTGKLERLQREFLEEARTYADSPPGLSLPRATEHRVTEIDVSFTLNQDIVDADGNVLFLAGLIVDPLHGRTITRVLCFADGTDEEQVAWLSRACTDVTRNKIVLVNGSLSDVGNRVGQRIYFDQRGYLVRVLGISALPTVVRQTGEGLYAEQIPIE